MEKNTPIILILCFIILATVGIVYIAIEKGAMNAPFVVSQPPQPYPSPIPPTTVTLPTPEISKDWKTYRNEKMKFEIKYPPDWKIDEDDGSVIIYKGEKIVTIPGSPISPYGKTLSVGIVERGKTCGDCNIYSPQELKNIMLNGYHAIGTIYNDSISSGFWIYSPAESHVLHLGYANPLIKIGQKDKQIDNLFQVILSTFRFLE